MFHPLLWILDSSVAQGITVRLHILNHKFSIVPMLLLNQTPTSVLSHKRVCGTLI